MREYVIDGVFLQRFGVSVKDEKSRRMVDRVMEQVRELLNKESMIENQNVSMKSTQY